MITARTAVAAALVAVSGLFMAPAAQADPYDQAVCAVLDDYPNNTGILGIGLALEDEGYTGYQAGQIIGQAVINVCPEYIPLMLRFADRYAPSGAVA